MVIPRRFLRVRKATTLRFQDKKTTTSRFQDQKATTASSCGILILMPLDKNESSGAPGDLNTSWPINFFRKYFMTPTNSSFLFKAYL